MKRTVAALPVAARRAEIVSTLAYSSIST